MKDYRRYVPILKSKAGEFWLLENMDDAQKAVTRPLMEIIHDEPVGAALRVGQIANAWNSDQSVFLDTNYMEHNSVADGVVVTSALDAAEVSDLAAIPVIRLAQHPSALAAIANSEMPSDFGICIRLVQNDFINPNTLNAAISAILTAVDLEAGDADLVIDYRVTPPIATLVAMILTQVGQIENIDQFRSITIASGAFPENLSNFSVGTWNDVPRSDWLAYQTLIGSAGETSNRLDYGDYLARHPDPPSAGFGGGANVRYALDEQWICQRRGKPGTEMKLICADLLNQGAFCGSTFSAGDERFHHVAQPTNADSGSSSQRVGWNASHHLVFTINQLAAI